MTAPNELPLELSAPALGPYFEDAHAALAERLAATVPRARTALGADRAEYAPLAAARALGCGTGSPVALDLFRYLVPEKHGDGRGSAAKRGASGALPRAVLMRFA